MSAVDAAGGRFALGSRFVSSEIRMVLRRRRNQLILLALIAIPVIIAMAAWCLTIALVVAVAGLAIGFALFPAGDVTLLSGTQITLAGGIGRLTIVVGYAALMMLALSAIGLFISTLTEVPIAAMAA